jgi:hypothetical protein
MLDVRLVVRGGTYYLATSLYGYGAVACLQSQWHTDSKSSSARVEVSFSPRPRTAHLRSASRNQVRCALQASHTRHDLMYAPRMRPGRVPDRSTGL